MIRQRRRFRIARRQTTDLGWVGHKICSPGRIAKASCASMLGFLRHRSSIAALLLLILQLGLVVHRLEHYIEPEHMECGDDACAAFTPVTDPPALPALVAVPTRVAFPVRYWIAIETIVVQPRGRLGFQAQAPPA